MRDKLMQKESNDIDIAVDNMTLDDFAATIDEHLNAERAAKSSDHQYQKAFSMRRGNTEKMKNIDMITITHEAGLALDFVTLEKDENGEASPSQDALHRDSTINALFYNINENKVEDYSCGIADL